MRFVLFTAIGILAQLFALQDVYAQAGATPVYLKFRSDKIYILDESRVEFVADLYIGTWAAPVQNLYAATFDFVYPADVILPEFTSFVYYSQSFLGEEQNIKVVSKDFQQILKGHLNISISRMDGKAISGFGKIGEVHFITIGDLIGSRNTDEIPFTVKAEYVKLVDADGRELPHETDPIGATILIVNDILAQSARIVNARQVAIFPNPASDQLYIQLRNVQGERLEIFNVAGQRVKNESVQGDQLQISTKDFHPGLYTIKIYTKEGVISRKVLLQ